MEQETKNIVILGIAIGAIYLLTKKPATKVNATGFRLTKEEMNPYHVPLTPLTPLQKELYQPVEPLEGKAIYMEKKNFLDMPQYAVSEPRQMPQFGVPIRQAAPFGKQVDYSNFAKGEYKNYVDTQSNNFFQPQMGSFLKNAPKISNVKPSL
jgi:hypothetical protein